MRLRQVVLVARDLEAAVDRLRAALPLAPPYRDPGVAAFGLRNAVMALGDTFVEVVSPTRPDTAAGRYRDRRGGDAGYMLMLQVDDMAAARARAAALGIRVVWRADGARIAGTHLHPKDTGGTLLSLDRPIPPGSWEWAGPAWTGGAPAAPGSTRIVGATVAAADPVAVARRWGALLGLEPADEAAPALALDGGSIAFVPAGDPRRQGLCAVDWVGAPQPDAAATETAAEIAGVRFRRRPAPSG